MKLTGYLLCLGLILTYSCKREPQACIELDSNSASAGTEVLMSSACSKHALSHEWFIEGPTGAPENDMIWTKDIIRVTFSMAGSYTITLNVYNKFSWQGDMHSTTESITIN